MAISQRLTDLYHLLRDTEGSPSFIKTPKFSAYLQELPFSSFCEFVFMLGFEARDIEFGSTDPFVEEAISILEGAYQSRTSVEGFEATDKDTALYLTGMANLHLYFCKRSGFRTTEVDLDTEDVLLIDIKQSVDHLRQALSLLDRAIDIAKGLYKYQVIQTLNYAWEVLDNYKVNNEDKPIDLDSAYVFTDQVPEGYLWEELVDQMRKHYQLR